MKPNSNTLRNQMDPFHHSARCITYEAQAKAHKYWGMDLRQHPVTSLE